MKIKAALCLAIITVTIAETAMAEIPVSITQFKNKAGSSNCRFQWDWWSDYIGNGFKEMLAEELTQSGQVALFERETIRDIYSDEHELINSEEDSSLVKGKFRKAKYTLVGAVTEFEYCASKDGGAVNVGALARLFGAPAPDLSIGKKGAKAKVVISLRVINTTTGQVVKTVKGEGEAQDKAFALDTEVVNYESQSHSPMGTAARQAIAKAAGEVLPILK